MPERLRLAEAGGAETLNFDDGEIFDRLRATTGGRGPDACIDAVGLEAHGTTIDFVDTPSVAAKQAKKSGKLVFVLHVSGHFEDPRFT